jgi:thiamine pyrophosphate-dependent acetolactate synthase large subunit-like protein
MRSDRSTASVLESEPGVLPSVAEHVGQALADAGVRVAFGVVGSGNFVVSNSLLGAGVRFHTARHEGGAIAMADGYGRTSGETGVCSVHQGPGLTNTMTGLAEAAKARTPILVLAGDCPAGDLHSNFRIDQHGLVESVGAIAERIHSPLSAAVDATRALRRAAVERRPVVLMMPVDLQDLPAQGTVGESRGSHSPPPLAPKPADEAVAAVADLIEASSSPILLAGRGAVLASARQPVAELAELAGALTATSAMAHGLFSGLPFDLRISGGFASPLAADLIARADLVLAFGASLNHWTTRRGSLLGDAAKVVQFDLDAGAIGANTQVHLAVVADVAAAADALCAELERRGVHRTGWRTPSTRREIEERRWRFEPYPGNGSNATIDPRKLSIAVDKRLPVERTVVVDSGHFLGYPAMYIGVPDARSWIFPNAFQAVGLGLASAVGAAAARPDRITVAAVGDGGFMMALPELETAVRLGLSLLVLIYDDCAYGAELHHFGPGGADTSLVRFPERDLASIARACGAGGAVVRSVDDLAAIDAWLEAPDAPLVLDAKVDPDVCADWLAEAFHEG